MAKNLSQIQQNIIKKEHKLEEARCVACARDFFKLLGEKSDILPMGDLNTPEHMQEIMVPIVDQMADIMVKHGLLHTEFNLVNKYMQIPVSEYTWRINEFVTGFKNALIEKATGKEMNKLSVGDLLLSVQGSIGTDKENKKSTE